MKKKILLVLRTHGLPMRLAPLLNEKKPYLIEIAWGEREALKKLSAARLDFSLLLIDHKIPEMNGLQVIRAARGRRSAQKLPSIILGDVEDINFSVATMRRMDFDFLPKPITSESLSCFIDNCFHRQERNAWAYYLDKTKVEKGENSCSQFFLSGGIA